MQKIYKTMIKKLFDYVMNNGEVSQKKNILTILSGNNDSVYTKKVILPNKKLKISGCLVKCLSLTSNSGKFGDVNPNDLRVNFTNVFDKWVNVQAHSLSGDSLKKIADALNIK